MWATTTARSTGATPATARWSAPLSHALTHACRRTRTSSSARPTSGTWGASAPPRRCPRGPLHGAHWVVGSGLRRPSSLSTLARLVRAWRTCTIGALRRRTSRSGPPSLPARRVAACEAASRCSTSPTSICALTATWRMRWGCTPTPARRPSRPIASTIACPARRTRGRTQSTTCSSITRVIDGGGAARSDRPAGLALLHGNATALVYSTFGGLLRRTVTPW
mmetsp:Transcript_31451/g.101788  ORF Transcript_31451/g.101788 Transcript_31451/m.101788 type:complete len:222 (-) Transcript_31451:142-807(-)